MGWLFLCLRRNLHQVVHLGIVCALTLSLVVGAIPLPGMEAAKIVYAAGSATGMVYVDYNANGVRDIGGAFAIDSGLGGVTVTAYNAAGTAVATTTSSTVAATLGQYTLNLSAVTGGTPLRIEFTNLPSGYQPAPHGSANATSVQFVTTTTGNLSNVDFGVSQPIEYCQAKSHTGYPFACLW